MLRRSLPALIALAATAAPHPAESRTVSVSTGSANRISKPARQPLTMFYASYLSQEQVQLWPYPGHVQVGQEFDLVDDRGLVGTVEVSQVNQQGRRLRHHVRCRRRRLQEPHLAQ